MKTVIIMILQL